MTIKSKEQNHFPASDGALWDIIPPEDFFNNPARAASWRGGGEFC